VRKALEPQGQARAAFVLRLARGALEDVREVLDTKAELERLEAFAKATESAFCLARGLDRPSARVCAGNIYRRALDGCLYTIWEEAYARLRLHRVELPEDMIPLMSLSERDILLRRLRLRAPALIECGATALAYWAIATGFERTIEVRGQADYEPTPDDPFFEFAMRREVDSRPFATRTEAEQHQAAVNGAVREGVAAEIFAARVDAWEHLLDGRHRRVRRHRGGSQE
jgi:hypothetical protein